MESIVHTLILGEHKANVNIQILHALMKVRQ
jgi:hypothetical protein